MLLARDEMALRASVIAPYWHGVKDAIIEAFERTVAQHCRLRKTELVVDRRGIIRDSARHFAGTNERGTVVLVAPEMADLPVPTLVAILAHECGHALDFAYPASWTWPKKGAGEAAWVGESVDERAGAWRRYYGRPMAVSRTRFDQEKPAVNWVRAGESRNDDQVEWAADGIVRQLTGRAIGYSGPCMLQTLEGGRLRPAGLR